MFSSLFHTTRKILLHKCMKSFMFNSFILKDFASHSISILNSRKIRTLQSKINESVIIINKKKRQYFFLYEEVNY